MTKESDELYEVFSNLPPELQKEFFHQLEQSQNELKKSLLAEVEKIQTEIQELKKLNSSRPSDRENGDELIDRVVNALIEEN